MTSHHMPTTQGVGNSSGEESGNTTGFFPVQNPTMKHRVATDKRAFSKPGSTVPARLNVRNANLPQSYEDARQALMNCDRLDECHDWANKAEALASYAKMADDDTLHKTAVRIKARAIRRCGELLKQFDARPSNAQKQSTGGDTLFSQKKAAERAGLSKRQKDTAVRVASVPSKEFESVVESKTPPSVPKLAEMGKKSHPKSHLYEEKPKGFAEATQAIGQVSEFAAFCQSNPPEKFVSGIYDYEVADVLKDVPVIQRWLTGLSSKLEAQS